MKERCGNKRRGNPEMIMQMKVFLTQINTVQWSAITIIIALI